MSTNKKMHKDITNPPMKINDIAPNQDINENKANYILTTFIEQTKKRNAELAGNKEEVKKKKKYYEEEFEDEAKKKVYDEIKSFMGIPSAKTVKDTLVKLNESYTESFKEQAKYTSALFQYISDVLGVLNAVIFMEILAFYKIRRNTNSIKKRAERINTLSQSLDKGTCSINELLDFFIDATADLEEKDEELNNEINKELSLLKNNLIEIKNTLSQKVDESILTGYATTLITDTLRADINGLNEHIKEKADESELSKYIKSEEVYTKDKIEKLLDTKADKTDLDNYIKVGAVYTNQEIDAKFKEWEAKRKHLWIAYGITTATLVAGLIASFLI